MFGFYDPTPTARCGHTVTNKRQASSFWTFKKVDQKQYDDNTRQVFLALDNASTHKPDKAKETLARHNPGMQSVHFFQQDHPSSTSQKLGDYGCTQASDKQHIFKRTGCG